MPLSSKDIVPLTRARAQLTELVEEVQAEGREKNDAIVRKVKGAMIYPAVIFSVAGIAVVILLIFVIPTFEQMFASVQMELPLPTRVVIGMSQLLQGYWWAMGAGIALGLSGLKKYYATSSGKLVIDRMLLKSPVVGDLLRKSAVVGGPGFGLYLLGLFMLLLGAGVNFTRLVWVGSSHSAPPATS